MEPPPTYDQAVRSRLLQSGQNDMPFRELAELYMMQPTLSGLDGSIHPALNAASHEVELDIRTHEWVRADSAPSRQNSERNTWKDGIETEDVDL
jgi:hypothetical protein